MTRVVMDLLAKTGVSQRELARRIGISSSMMSQRMNGITPWKFDEVFEVCEVLGVSEVWLVNEVKRQGARQQS